MGKQENFLGDDGYIQYLDCELHNCKKICQNSKNRAPKMVTFTVQKVYLNKQTPPVISFYTILTTYLIGVINCFHFFLIYFSH